MQMTPGILQSIWHEAAAHQICCTAMQENVMPHKDELLNRVQNLNQVRSDNDIEACQLTS